MAILTDNERRLFMNLVICLKRNHLASLELILQKTNLVELGELERKLPEEKDFFDEVRTFRRTHKIRTQAKFKLV